MQSRWRISISKPAASDKIAISGQNRLFTADQHIVLYKAGHLTNGKLHEVIRKIVEIVQQ
jgi:hypothetical protein